VLGVLIFDTTLVSVSRLRRGRSIFQGGSDHTSHRLVRLGLSQPRAVLTLYLAAVALGAAAIFITRWPPLLANLAFAGLVAAGLALLAFFDRVEPALSGDPPLALLPGGGGLAEAARAAAELSREVVLLLAPRRVAGEVRPSREEVAEALAALAEDPPAARRLLAGGLAEAWWEDLNTLNRVLRLNGVAWSVLAEPLADLPAPDAGWELDGQTAPEVLAAVKKAQLVLLGPGDPAVNLAPLLAAPGMRAALRGARGPRLFAGPAAAQAAVEAWLGEPTPATSGARLALEMHNRLLRQAAGQAKTGHAAG
jgi:hypothetical protein